MEQQHRTDPPGGRDNEGLLALWQARAARAAEAAAADRARMEEREALYRGTRSVDRVTASGETRSGEGTAPATVVRNIVAESIEGLVESTIPQPKVTPRHLEDRPLAALIEDLLRGELDRLPFEVLNDMDERTTPIQGGDFFLVEWDSGAGGAHPGGELSVSLLHPRQVLGQPGVLRLEDMDYVIVERLQTRERLERRYGVPLGQPNEGAAAPDETLTQYTAYYRNRSGGIGLFRWAEDQVLQQLEDYQARRVRLCEACGEPMGAVCAHCGGHAFREREEAFLPAAAGRPAGIPHYKPGCFPLVLRKNVSLYGQLLGDSDVDKIRDQQNTIKKVTTRIEEKIGKGGSIVTLPRQLAIRTTDEELKVVELDSPAQKAMIDVLTIQPDIGKDLAYLEYSYQSGRQVLGLTDSFQGRSDSTAHSGVAKQFAAAQTAGRLESRRIMKQAAYAELFALMFKFLLAYADEPRAVARRTLSGGTEVLHFDRYAFLQQDGEGEWFWNDHFLFSVDAAASLAANRQAMWEETLRSLQNGAFGNPGELETLILYWSKLELLHYPGAKDTREQLERRRGERGDTDALPHLRDREEAVLL
ncbi:MAG: hypothetical protein GXX99_01580 [Clostridiales bacterium]|nr:hypothetical protein [Clostridiales bacterium]